MNDYASKPKFVACGGSGGNEARVYDVSSKNACVGVAREFTRAVFTCDWSPTEDKLAVAGGDATVKFINVVQKSKVEEAAADENINKDMQNIKIDDNSA